MSELEQLKMEMAQLYHTNIELNKKLKLSESLKSNFISNIMNEVYNPFSAIKMMADNLIHLNEKSVDKVVPMAETIYREAAQLDFHLQNVFAAAKIEAGLESVHFTEVDVSQLVEEAIIFFKIPIQDKRLNIKHQVNMNGQDSFVNDKEKISLVLLNLLSNAIKNSPDGGTISIDIGLNDNVLNLYVSDEGPGIPKSEVDFIFDRFRRVNDTINSVNGGTGLGLSVVKAIAELLGGGIELNTTHGTKLSITIPGNMELPKEDDDPFPEDELF